MKREDAAEEGTEKAGEIKKLYQTIKKQKQQTTAKKHQKNQEKSSSRRKRKCKEQPPEFFAIAEMEELEVLSEV